MDHSDRRDDAEPGLRFAELLDPTPAPWWSLLPQIGVTDVIGLLADGEQLRRWMRPTPGDPRGWVAADQSAPPRGERAWEPVALRRLQEGYRERGLTLVGLEDSPPMDLIRLGLPGRDEQIEWWIDMIRAAGSLGLRVLCYNWMAIRGWLRTEVAIPSRGGARVSGYSTRAIDAHPRAAQPGQYSAEQLWEGLAYFLAAVLPEAEAAGVVLGMHPDDPPLPEISGLPRIMNSVENYDRLLALSDSASNAITFCQGNFSLMSGDLVGLIRRWSDRIAYVHLRDVVGEVDDFRETFHDDGPTDLLACLRAYAEIGFTGPMRPDHVPTLAGEDNDRPGYMVLGRLHAFGYLAGLREAAYGKPNRRAAGGH